MEMAGGREVQEEPKGAISQGGAGKPQRQHHENHGRKEDDHLTV